MPGRERRIPDHGHVAREAFAFEALSLVKQRFDRSAPGGVDLFRFAFLAYELEKMPRGIGSIPSPGDEQILQETHNFLDEVWRGVKVARDFSGSPKMDPKDEGANVKYLFGSALFDVYAKGLGLELSELDRETELFFQKMIQVVDQLRLGEPVEETNLTEFQGFWQSSRDFILSYSDRKCVPQKPVLRGVGSV